MNKQNNKSWPPKSCDMPNLANLNDTLSLALMLNKFLRGGGPKNHISYALVANFIRFADQTLQSYNAARDALLEYINTPNQVFSPYFKAIGHCELCVISLNRSVKFAKRIQKDQNILQVPKNLSILSNPVGQRIRTFRNGIEHFDEDILNGKIQKGEFISLIVNSDSIKLLGNEISFGEIAAWIKELNSLASTLATYTE